MKLAIALSAVIVAVVFALQPANAVDDAPSARMQLIEVEQQTPYLESFAGVTAGTATTSIVRRVAGITFSSQAYAQFDNHNGDGSRATFGLEVEDADTYGVSAALVKGPNFGIVQLFIDGPNDRFVSKDSRFWNASGVDVSLGADGLKMNTQSLATVISTSCRPHLRARFTSLPM